ncbi:hypothetical protein K491DRAFT_692669 [Lophiostoma macrostomum CBS 122681]|uniref:Uncharacterized protein n=1 Tax=Lophiostoma macrostomum CBS 122681 TaxID=1314788 RepID=A0A6A6TAW8_9PLEO|nr:hypothetical protein K491DRAFT_692669 [Lophiostoma macrostomum CBS 122681]
MRLWRARFTIEECTDHSELLVGPQAIRSTAEGELRTATSLVVCLARSLLPLSPGGGVNVCLAEILFALLMIAPMASVSVIIFISTTLENCEDARNCTKDIMVGRAGRDDKRGGEGMGQPDLHIEWRKVRATAKP